MTVLARDTLRFAAKTALGTIWLVILFFVFVLLVGYLFDPGIRVSLPVPYLVAGLVVAGVVTRLANTRLKLPWWANFLSAIAAFPCATLVLNLLINGSRHG